MAPLVLSWFSPGLYRSVAAHWRAKAAVYLIVLLTLLAVPNLLKMHAAFTAGMRMLREAAATQIPTITIMKGEVHTPEARAYEIRLRPSAAPAIVIDTTGKTTMFNKVGPSILVTKNQVFIRKSAAETRIYNLSGVNYFQINEERVNRWLDRFQKWFPLLFFPLVLGSWYLIRFSAALLLAILGVALVAWLESDVKLPALLSLAIVSMTPSLMLQSILGAAVGHFRFQGLVYLGCTVGYFLFAINAATDKTEDFVE